MSFKVYFNSQKHEKGKRRFFVRLKEICKEKGIPFTTLKDLREKHGVNVCFVDFSKWVSEKDGNDEPKNIG